MSKNILKKDGLYVLSKKTIYIRYIIIFILVIFLSYFFSIYKNKSIIDNSKSVHYRNIELNKKNSLLENYLREKESEIKKYKKNNDELSSIFKKYTEAVKFNLATAEEIKNSLFSKDEKILELEREINYYKFIENSKNKKDTISIENFNVSTMKKDNSIDYNFLLLSNGNKSNIVGTFSFYYDAFILNSNQVIVRKKLNVKNTKLNFKNYLGLKGKVLIPDNHIISVLYLDVKCNGKIYNHKHEFIKF